MSQRTTTTQLEPAAAGVGERLWQLRQRTGLGVRTFGATIGVGHSTISRAERGIGSLTLDNLILYCEGTGASADWILFGKGRPPRRRR